MLVLSYTICILFQTHKRHGVMKFVLCSTNTHTPLFYGVSKRHKPNFSLHSIILRCDHYTGRLSLCITYFIQPLANNLPSHIKDTKYFLNFIVNLPPLPSNTLSVTADVTFSYSNVPHDDCISMSSNSWREASISCVQVVQLPTQFVKSLISLLNTAPSVSLFQLCLFLEIHLHWH